MAKEARDGLRVRSRPTGSSASRPSIDNIRSAMAFALAGGVDPFIAVKFAVARMQGFWILRGYSTEGRKSFARRCAWPRCRLRPCARMALYVGAALAESQSDYAEAREMLETCLALRRRLGNTLTSPQPCRHFRSCGCTRAMRKRPPKARTRPCGFSGTRISPGRTDRPAAPGPDRTVPGRRRGSEVAPRAGLSIAPRLKHQESQGECELLLGELAFFRGDQAMPSSGSNGR